MPFDVSRRRFIASTTTIVAASVAVETIAALPAPAETATSLPVSATVPFHFDRAAFAAVLDLPYPHRQVCAPPSYVAATVAMAHFSNAIDAYADPAGFAAGPKSLHCIAVLYSGMSAIMVLDDAMFAKYPVGLLADEEMRPNDTSGRAFWKAMKKNNMGDFIRPLSDRGVSFLVCNNALTGLAFTLAKRTAPDGTAVTRERVVAVHDELAEHFIAGTMLVPSGAAAVNAVQEAKFTLLP